MDANSRGKVCAKWLVRGTCEGNIWHVCIYCRYRYIHTDRYKHKIRLSEHDILGLRVVHFSHPLNLYINYCTVYIHIGTDIYIQIDISTKLDFPSACILGLRVVHFSPLTRRSAEPNVFLILLHPQRSFIFCSQSRHNIWSLYLFTQHLCCLLPCISGATVSCTYTLYSKHR